MKLGILGTGMIVHDLMQTFNELGIEETYLFATTHSKEKAEKLVNDYHLNGVYYDYDDLLNTKQIMLSLNDEINFKEGWSLQFPTGYCKKLSQLNRGDTVEVVSRIKDVSSSTITVYDYGYRFENGRQVPINGTSIKLNGEEICIVNK